MENVLFEEIKKSLEVITEGNWAFVCHNDGQTSLISTKSEEIHERYKEQEDWVYIAKFLDTTKACDLNFVANSKKFVQSLVTEVESLRKEQDMQKSKAELWGLEDASLPKPIEDWHEDDGDCLWWHFPIFESPYCGSPLDTDFPDYVTHFTKIILPIGR